MQDSDLESVYKTALPVSHYAGLRAVYDAGYDAGAGINTQSSAGDASLVQAAPTGVFAPATAITTP